MYGSTDTRKTQSSLSDRALDILGTRATNKMRWGYARAVLGGFLLAMAGSQLRESMDSNVQRFELLPDDPIRHTTTQILFMQGLKSVFICVFSNFYLCVALRHLMQYSHCHLGTSRGRT